MTEYTLVTHPHVLEFEGQVNALLRQGWRLYRGPFYAIRDGGFLIQPMTREVKRIIPPPPDEPIGEPLPPETVKAKFDEMRALLSR